MARTCVPQAAKFVQDSVCTFVRHVEREPASKRVSETGAAAHIFYSILYALIIILKACTGRWAPVERSNRTQNAHSYAYIHTLNVSRSLYALGVVTVVARVAIRQPASQAKCWL